MRPPLNEFFEYRSLSKLDGLWKVVHHGNLITVIAPATGSLFFRKMVNQDNLITQADFER